MNKKLFISLFALLFSLSVSARVEMAGLYNSPKGVGLCIVEGSEKNTFTSFSALLDTYGIYGRKDITPGIRFNISRQYYISGYRYGDARLYLFAGSGASAGFVHDNGLLDVPLMPMGAVSGSFGITTDNPRKINITLCITAEVGICAGPNGTVWYMNGIQRALHPEICIFWKL